MTLDAKEIIELISTGVEDAFATDRLFLGVEKDAFHNADIRPEYLTTVSVAKALIKADHQISIEAHMKELRKQAGGLAWVRQGGTSAARAKIESLLAGYRFGKKDRQRLDILVRQADEIIPPLLMIEAKLGVANLPGVILDINRILRIFDMYSDLQLLGHYNIYGAVVFHSMEEGNDTGAAGTRARTLLQDVQAHLVKTNATRPWLKSQAGLLKQGTVMQPVTGYTEDYDDGVSETVFAKNSFHFAPGLVLMGNAQDVLTADF